MYQNYSPKNFNVTKKYFELLFTPLVECLGVPTLINVENF